MKQAKWLALAVAVAMVCAMLPMTALAAGNAAEVSAKDEFLGALADSSVTTIRVTAGMDLTDIPAGAGNVIDISGRTIDLGGNTVKINNFALIFQGSNFTIQNGTLDGNGGSYALFIGDGPTRDVLIQHVTTIGGINVFNSTHVVLRDVDVTGGRHYAVWCDEGGQVTIESGTFRANQENGTAVLGMADNNEGNGYAADATLDIVDGTFQSNGMPLVLDDGKDREPPVISGGAYDCSAKAYVADGLEFECNSDGVYTYHETLADALKDAGANAVITAVDNPPAADRAFTATLAYNDGSGKVVQMVADAKGKVTLPAVDRSGYLFLGWDDGSGHPAAANQVYTLTENVTLTGEWVALTKEKIEAKAATCTQEGNAEYWYCPELDGYFSDEALTQRILLADTVIPAAGHGETELRGVKDATCTQEGYTGDTVCTVCGDVVQQGAVTAKLAHAFQNGKCSVCGAADPSVAPAGPTATPKPTGKPQAGIPQTGEAGDWTLWGLLLLVSGLGMAGAALYGAKKTVKH